MGIFDKLFNKKQVNTKPQSYNHNEIQLNNSAQIINDCIRIINETKNIETGLSRFDVLKENLIRMFEYIPPGKKLELKLGDIEINTINDLYIIDSMKSDWLSSMNNSKTKHEEIYSQALAEWIKKFKEAIEDNIITDEELLELESLQENLGLSEEDTAIFWQNCTAKIPDNKSNTGIEATNDLDLPDNSNWDLTVQFGKSKSNVFSLVLSSIEIHPSYKKFTGNNGEDIHEVVFKPNEMLIFDELWSRIKTWKSTIVKINNENIPKKDISKILICFRDKLKSKDTNPLFCYGASPFTFNLFGCHRTMLRDGVIASQKCWYHIGRFDKSGIFHVDKKAIQALLIKNITPYKYCPALNITTIKEGLDLLPNTIDHVKEEDWTLEEDYMGNKMLIPTLQYKEYDGITMTEKVGDINVTFSASAAMVDYYASISPQFNRLLEKIIK